MIFLFSAELAESLGTLVFVESPKPLANLGSFTRVGGKHMYTYFTGEEIEEGRLHGAVGI